MGGAAKPDGAKRDATPSDSFTVSLAWAIVAVFIFGLGCIIGLTAMMKQLLKFGDGIIIAVMLVSFLLMFVIEATFIRLLLRRRRDDAKETHVGKDATMTQLKEQPTKVLDAAQTPVHSLAEPIASITEHTTRDFEPLYARRKTE